MIQQTSIQAYHEIKLGPDQQIVLRYLTVYGDKTDHELEKEMGWKINRITGRRNELVRYGYVVIKGRKLNTDTGCSNIVWGINNNDPQLQMF